MPSSTFLDATAVSVSDASFVNNSALSGEGGAVFVSTDPGYSSTMSVSLDCERCTFTSNAAGTGGAMYLDGVATWALRQSVLSDNVATEGQGGAVFSAGAAAATVADCSLDRNSAAADGGAMWVSSATFSASGSAFVGNACQNDGGALALAASTLAELDGCVFRGNAAAGIAARGGAVVVSAARAVVIRGSTFSGNEADASTAAAAAVSGNASSSTAAAVAAEVIAASSRFLAGAGGALLILSDGAAPGRFVATTELSDTTFDSNVAAAAGGAVATWGSNVVTVAGVVFNRNRACTGNAGIPSAQRISALSGQGLLDGVAALLAQTTLDQSCAGADPGNPIGGGGAVWVGSGSAWTLRNTTVQGNIALSGGAFYVTGGGSADFRFGSVAANVAGDGAVFAARGAAAASLFNSTLDGNCAFVGAGYSLGGGAHLLASVAFESAFESASASPSAPASVPPISFAGARGALVDSAIPWADPNCGDACVSLAPSAAAASPSPVPLSTPPALVNVTFPASARTGSFFAGKAQLFDGFGSLMPRWPSSLASISCYLQARAISARAPGNSHVFHGHSALFGSESPCVCPQSAQLGRPLQCPLQVAPAGDPQEGQPSGAKPCELGALQGLLQSVFINGSAAFGPLLQGPPGTTFVLQVSWSGSSAVKPHRAVSIQGL